LLLGALPNVVPLDVSYGVLLYRYVALSGLSLRAMAKRRALPLAYVFRPFRACFYGGRGSTGLGPVLGDDALSGLRTDSPERALYIREGHCPSLMKRIDTYIALKGRNMIMVLFLF